MIKIQENKFSEIALDALTALNKYKLTNFKPIIIREKKVGWINNKNQELLSKNSFLFANKKQNIIELKLSDAEHFFQKMYTELVSKNLVRTDVNEKCPVFETNSLEPLINFDYSLKFGEKKMFDVQRSILGFFGLPAYGVHLNGWKVKKKENFFLLAKRSKKILKFPGLYDNLVGGGLTSNLSIEENLAKEAYEEAGIIKSRIKKAKPGSAISYIHTNQRFFSPSVIFTYDLELIDEEEFRNTDGEIESFRYFGTNEVFQLAEKKLIKPNCFIPIIDFLVRKKIKVFSENALKEIKKFLM